MFGWEPDKYDSRDRFFGVSASARVPQSFLLSHLGIPFDQSPLSSCVAQAIAKAIYASHISQGVKNPEPMSRMAIWYFARAMIGAQHHDFGCMIRDGFKALNRLGFCPESLWPYVNLKGSGRTFDKMPPTNAFRMSYDQRAGGVRPVSYRSIKKQGDARLSAVRTAVASGRPVIFGTNVSQDFAEGKLPNGPIPAPSGVTMAGGHAMLIGGYTPDGFEVMNSWGSDWGFAGWCTFSEEYITSSMTRDLWVVDVAPTFG